MVDKIDNFSPMKEIIDHFDSLINRVDIDIDECLEKYQEEQILNQLQCFEIGKRNLKSLDRFFLESYGSSKSEKHQYQTVDEWPESTKVVEYLNLVRKRTIDELNKAQEDTLEYYKQNSSQFKSQDIDQKKIDEIRSEIFPEKFYFQVLYKPNDEKYSKPWIFNLFTFVTDFYMSSSDIKLLEKLINSSHGENEKFKEKCLDPDSKIIFDEKMVLLGLLQKHFFENLQTQKFPSHVISVRKQDLLTIRRIDFNYRLNEVNLTDTSKEFSNLEKLNLFGRIIESAEIKIERISSLKYLRLHCYSNKQFTLRNLISLRLFYLQCFTPINSELLSRIFDYLPSIEILKLNGELSNFNLDSLINLKGLYLIGKIMADFNFSLFDNLCNRLKEIQINCTNIDDKCLDKLFYSRNFSCLIILHVARSKITKLEKKFFNQFPMFQEVLIYFNQDLRIIDHDTFLNLKQLTCLHLGNNRIKSIDKGLFSNLNKLVYLNLSKNQLEEIEENAFSSLENLEVLFLSENQLKSLDPNLFVGLNNLKLLFLKDNKLSSFDLKILDYIGQIEKIDLSRNPIINEVEILKDRFKKSKINFHF